jgi:hypothetical protein
MRGDFAGPYSVPTQTYPLNWRPPTIIPVGTWTLATSGSITDSFGNAYATSDPTQVMLSTGATAQHGFQAQLQMTLSNTIVADGVLSFDYSIVLGATGQNQGTNYGGYALNGILFQLQPGTGLVSLPVIAGDAFEFRAWAYGSCYSCSPGFAGATAITITNFSAPVPEPTVLCLLAFGFAAFVLRKRFRPR